MLVKLRTPSAPRAAHAALRRTAAHAATDRPCPPIAPLGPAAGAARLCAARASSTALDRHYPHPSSRLRRWCGDSRHSLRSARCAPITTLAASRQALSPIQPSNGGARTSPQCGSSCGACLAPAGLHLALFAWVAHFVTPPPGRPHGLSCLSLHPGPPLWSVHTSHEDGICLGAWRWRCAKRTDATFHRPVRISRNNGGLVSALVCRFYHSRELNDS